MSYELVGWENKPSEKTPLGAKNLSHMDNGIKYAHDLLDSKATSIICTATGKTILTTDSANAPLVNLKAKGDTWQKQYEGNNLVDFRNITVSDNGITAKGDDEGVITVTGEPIPIEGSNFLLTVKRPVDLSLLENGKIYKTNVNTWIVKNGQTLYDTGFRMEEDITEANIYKNILLSEYKDGYVFKPVLYLDGFDTSEFEPYVGGQPSPNTKYKQPIESLENVEVKVLRSNLFDVDKALETYVYNVEGRAYFKFINGQTYTMSIDSTGVNNSTWLCVSSNAWNNGRIETSRILMSSVGRLSKTFTIPNDNLDYYLCACVSGAPTVKQFKELFNGNKCENLQIQLGSVATEYEPFKEPQTITLTSPVPITKWDRLVNRDGVWGVSVYHLHVVINDGDWGYSRTDNWFSKSSLLPHAMTRRDGYCNLCRAMTSLSQRTEPNMIEIGAGNNVLYLWNTDFHDSTLSDFGLSNLGAFLKENPLEIWTYADEEQDFIPLSDEEQEMIKSVLMNYPTTTILSNAELEVEYVADTKNYIDNKFKELEANVTSAIAQLL